MATALSQCGLGQHPGVGGLTANANDRPPPDLRSPRAARCVVTHLPCGPRAAYGPTTRDFGSVAPITPNRWFLPNPSGKRSPLRTLCEVSSGPRPPSKLDAPLRAGRGSRAHSEALQVGDKSFCSFLTIEAKVCCILFRVPPLSFLFQLLGNSGEGEKNGRGELRASGSGPTRWTFEGAMREGLLPAKGA